MLLFPSYFYCATYFRCKIEEESVTKYGMLEEEGNVGKSEEEEAELVEMAGHLTSKTLDL